MYPLRMKFGRRWRLMGDALPDSQKVYMRHNEAQAVQIDVFLCTVRDQVVISQSAETPKRAGPRTLIQVSRSCAGYVD